MALSNPTGIKIRDLIIELFNNGSKTIDFDEEYFYHCRKHIKNRMPYTFEEMLKAPHGIPGAGRYNRVGSSCYYFSNTKKGAETEIQKYLKEGEVLQTVKIYTNKNANILDLSNSLERRSTFLQYLRYKVEDLNSSMPREYLLPNFVADCCKRIGFDGIKYYGSKEYNNYVTWTDGYFMYSTMC